MMQQKQNRNNNYFKRSRKNNFWILFILKKEVFVMEENEKITLTPKMEEELSNGKEEGEEYGIFKFN